MTDNFTTDDLRESFHTITSLISRTEKVKEKFTRGTSQHTLQKNRLNTLEIALSLISRELAGENIPDYSPEELARALPPLNSLINKSEKSLIKLSPGTWQHTMLNKNLAALNLASLLLNRESSDINH